MVANGKRKIGELAIVGDIRIDGKVLTRARAKVIQKFCDTLVAIGVFAERVDDPDLTRTNSCGKCSRLGVSRDELDILDALAIRDRDGGDYLP